MKSYQQLTLFEDERMTMTKAIALTAEYLTEYFKRYRQVAIAFSGGKDSSALVSLVCYLIKTGQVKAPEKLTVIYADTRQELPPLHISAMAMLESVRDCGFETRIAVAPIDKRFLVYILGRGVPPPNNTTLRWCTQQIKVNPMMAALGNLRNELAEGERFLMLTGVRIGESAARDQRISISCSKNGSECGQGWFQNSTFDRTDTLAPIIHWRVCQIWEWLITGEIEHGFPTYLVAAAYGGDDAEEINARTGCIGCPLVSKEIALDAIVAMPEWSYLAPLKRLKPIYEEMRSFNHRLQKDGTETNKDGSLVYNPGRKGPLTLKSRLYFLEKILEIQSEINSKVSEEYKKISLINSEEEDRIRELIELKTFPNKWTGDEPLGDILLPETLPDGSIQPLIPLLWN